MNTKELEVFYNPLFTRTQGLRLKLIGSFMDFKGYNYNKEKMS